MSQGHYLGSIKNNQRLDPQFKSLLKHHWIEEVQHAKLDGLVLKSLAQRSSAQDIATAIQEYFEIGAFLDGGFKQQTQLDLDSLEWAIGRALSEDERRRFLDKPAYTGKLNSAFQAAVGNLRGATVHRRLTRKSRGPPLPSSMAPCVPGQE
jgi:hypothetical protein